MRATPRGKKSNSRQEVFVCLSVLTFCALWLPLCIKQYPNNVSIDAGLNILLFSFLSSTTGCSLFLVAVICDFKGYQKASPIFLLLSIILAFVGMFIFTSQYCNAFFPSNDYSHCFVAECFSFLNYILTSYYVISMILARTNFKLGLSDLQQLKNIFGSKARVRIMLMVNISMLVTTFIDIRIYSYSLNNLDMLWVAVCCIFSVISILITLILLRFQICIPYIAHTWFLSLLIIVTFFAFGIGVTTVWKYRFSDSDGLAQIGNVFIWCVVNLWMLVAIELDIITIKKQSIQYLNVAQTDQEISPSETDEI